MFIEKLVVEGGFLNGVSIDFSEKLNVIIGPRGCGKTSVIELIRYCLGVDAMTSRFNTIAQKHAIGVLGSGRVTVVLNIDGERLNVSRSVEENDLKYRGFDQPIILSQNEIEEIGLDLKGRLKIIDGFVAESESVDSEERSYAFLRSVTEEINSLRNEIEKLSDSIDATHEQEIELKTLLDEQRTYLELHKVAQKDHQELEIATQTLSQLKVQKNSCERGLSFFRDLVGKLDDVATESKSQEIFSPLKNIVADELKSLLEVIQEYLINATETAGKGTEILTKISEETTITLSEHQEQIRQLRVKLDKITEGAGSVSKRIGKIKELIALSIYHKEMILSKNKNIDALVQKRTNVISLLESSRKLRYKHRCSVIKQLNKELKPLIKLSIDHMGHVAEYTSIITTKLRGSGVHFSNIAINLAMSLSPNELVKMIERGDVKNLSEVTGISTNKSEKIIEHLRSSSLSDILSAPIDDMVKFYLLDGTEYKPTENLSMGQRCTVILPILLQHTQRVLLVDQPEDHLDNAYVANVLTHAINGRKNRGQIILTTHNPNIPVLGEAEQVICLGSDGKRGFVRSANYLDHPDSRELISTVMEGGAEAFAKRTLFYNHNANSL